MKRNNEGILFEFRPVVSGNHASIEILGDLRVFNNMKSGKMNQFLISKFSEYYCGCFFLSANVDKIIFSSELIHIVDNSFSKKKMNNKSIYFPI